MRNSTDEVIRCPLRLYDGAPDVQNKLRRNVEINSHVTYEIENDYFKGHLLFFVEGLSSTPVHLFKDHKRKSHFIVQVSRSKLYSCCLVSESEGHSLKASLNTCF
jgi:hypothetical protein